MSEVHQEKMIINLGSFYRDIQGRLVKPIDIYSKNQIKYVVFETENKEEKLPWLDFCNMIKIPGENVEFVYDGSITIK